MRRLSRAVLVTALVAAFVPVLTPPALAATPGPAPTAGATAPADAAGHDLVVFGISPADASGPDNRAYLAMTAPAGSVVHDHVALLNQSDGALTLSTYTADIALTEDGGITASSRAGGVADAGAWISLDSADQLEVPAQSSATGIGDVVVPVTVSIPKNAQPGDHVGGIVAALTATAPGAAGTPGVQLEQRVVARVYIRVAGDLTPGLSITDVRVRYERVGVLGAGRLKVSYALQNTGNVRLAVDPTVTVEGPFGMLRRSAAGRPVEELLPGSRITQSVTVVGVWALVRHSVTIDAAVSAAPGGTDPGLGIVSAGSVVWLVPWLAIGVLVAVLVVLTLLGLRRRRRAAGVQGGRRRH
jgi:hypothetical protein